MTATVIRNGDWVVAWGKVSQSHPYLRDTDIAFDSNGIIAAGNSYDGEDEAEIDGRQLVLENGDPLNIDLATAVQALEKAQERCLGQVIKWD